MRILWKGAAVLGLALASLGVTSAPASAQHRYDERGWRGDRGGEWRGDRDRRWDNRRHWRGDRRHWNKRSSHWRGSGYRQRCWTEWQRGYRGERVRVRYCR